MAKEMNSLRAAAAKTIMYVDLLCAFFLIVSFMSNSKVAQTVSCVNYAIHSN